MSGRASNKKEGDGGIAWITSGAREILWEDFFTRDGFLFNNPNIPAEEAYGLYKNVHPDFFGKVTFEQFKSNYVRYQRESNERHVQSQLQESCLGHDRALNPRKTHNARGEPVFDMTPAKALLREDVRNRLHESMTPAALQATRAEYQQFLPVKFKERIYQEVRYQKFCNWLEYSRTKKRHEELEKHNKKRAAAQKDHEWSKTTTKIMMTQSTSNEASKKARHDN